MWGKALGKALGALFSAHKYKFALLGFAAFILLGLAAQLWHARSVKTALDTAYAKGYAAHKAKVDAAELDIKAKQTKASQQVDAAAAQALTKVRTVFKDRLIYKNQELPSDTIIKMDAECVIPVRFVELWNSANRAELPDTARALDASPSNLALSDVEAQKEFEAELCHTNTEQLMQLQDWVRKMQSIDSSKAKAKVD